VKGRKRKRGRKRRKSWSTREKRPRPPQEDEIAKGKKEGEKEGGKDVEIPRPYLKNDKKTSKAWDVTARSRKGKRMGTT